MDLIRRLQEPNAKNADSPLVKACSSTSQPIEDSHLQASLWSPRYLIELERQLGEATGKGNDMHLSRSVFSIGRSAEDVSCTKPDLRMVKSCSSLDHAFEENCPLPPAPPYMCMWTLWSVLRKPEIALDAFSIRRQDFASEADARAAFNVVVSHPCILRDPHGAEIATHAWNASYYQLLQRNGTVRRAATSPFRPSSRGRALSPIQVPLLR